MFKPRNIFLILMANYVIMIVTCLFIEMSLISNTAKEITMMVQLAVSCCQSNYSSRAKIVSNTGIRWDTGEFFCTSLFAECSLIDQMLQSWLICISALSTRYKTCFWKFAFNIVGRLCELQTHCLNRMLCASFSACRGHHKLSHVVTISGTSRVLFILQVACS